MNDNFNYEPEITMSDDEKKSHKKIFSKLGLAFLTYIIISKGFSIIVELALYAFDPSLLENVNLLLLISCFVQYCIALPFFVYFLRGIPKQSPVPNKIESKMYFKYIAVVMFFAYFGSYISTIVMTYIQAFLGVTSQNVVNSLLDNVSIWVSLILVGIIGPIAEEFMFRKLFVDRLMPYGEVVAVFFSALVFGLLHANLYQFFYAFLLGILFSFIYIRSGKIIYSTALHIFVNLFFGVLPSVISRMFDYEEFIELSFAGTITEEYINANMLPLFLLGVYEFVMLAMVGIGLFTFVKNYRTIQWNKGRVTFPKGTASDVIFFNVGTILFVATCILLMALNTFSV